MLGGPISHPTCVENKRLLTSDQKESRQPEFLERNILKDLKLLGPDTDAPVSVLGKILKPTSVAYLYHAIYFVKVFNIIVLLGWRVIFNESPIILAPT